MAWWHEVLGLEATLGNAGSMSGQKPTPQEPGLVTQAITKYVGVSSAGTGGAWIMRQAVNLGMLPNAEQYKEATRAIPEGVLGRTKWAVTKPKESIPMFITRAMWGADSQIDRQLQTDLRPFVRDVNIAVAEAAKKRGDYNIVLRIGMELFGERGTRDLLHAEQIAQHESGDIRDVEKQFAQRLVMEQRTRGGINPVGWIARQSRELLLGVVADGGVKQVGRDEFNALGELMGQIDAKEGLDIAKVTWRNAFWSSIFQRAKSINPELFLGDGGVTISVTQNGQVVRRLGYETKEIAPNAQQLVIQTDQPDWVEATRSMVEDKMRIPVATKFVQGQMKKDDDPAHYYRDVGTVTLGRSGAGGKDSQVDIPTISVSRTLKTIRAGLEAVGLSTARMQKLREEVPHLTESSEQFRSSVVEMLSEAVLHSMPRSRVVIDEAHRIEASSTSYSLQQDDLLRSMGLPTVVNETLANGIASQTDVQRNNAITELARRSGDANRAEEAMIILESRARMVLGAL
jgi:hypothetical protein